MAANWSRDNLDIPVEIDRAIDKLVRSILLDYEGSAKTYPTIADPQPYERKIESISNRINSRITEQFEGETSLDLVTIASIRSRDTYQLLTRTLENLAHGIALYDADDRMIFCNERMRSWNAKTAHLYVPGVKFEDLVRANFEADHILDLDVDVETFIQTRLEQHRNPKGPIIQKRSDGLWLELREQKTPDGFTFILNIDITERMLAEQALEKALQEAEAASTAKSQFLAMMSHELRTPLNAILGFSEVLSGQYLGPPGAGMYKEYAKHIHDSGTHLLNLVNDLLDLSAIEAGQKTLTMEHIQCAPLVRECARIVEGQKGDKTLEMDLHFVPDADLTIYGDRRAITQVLLNLLGNASKHVPDNGRIDITSIATEGGVEIAVADNGSGISKDQIASLTDPFRRGVHGAEIADKGWGLGLSITKSLVELHGGTLAIDSDVGVGSTITVFFPSAPD